MDVDPRCREHRPIIDASADHHANAGSVQTEPEAKPDHDRRAKHNQPIDRIGQKHGNAIGADRRDHRQRHRAIQPIGSRYLIGSPRPDGEHKIGRNDRYTDGDHGLAQFVALDAAKHQNLHDHAHQGEDDKSRSDTDKPRTSASGNLIADIGAEQIERAVREIDVAHEPEHQREAARDQKIQAG